MDARLVSIVQKALDKLGPVADEIVESMEDGDPIPETRRKALLAAMQFLDDFPNEEISDAVGFACVTLLAVYHFMASDQDGPKRQPPSVN